MLKTHKMRPVNTLQAAFLVTIQAKDTHSISSAVSNISLPIFSFSLRSAMLNYYHVLCIAPTASRSDIEAALAKQHALGKLPPATLKLAADTLLTPESREVYDAKLASLPEMNQAYALSADDLALNTSAATPPVARAAANNDVPEEADNSITLYDNIRLPETNSRAFSMAKVKQTIITSPVIWLLFAVLFFKLFSMATQESDHDKAEAMCISAIQAQLPYPDSLSIKPIDAEYPWRHRQTEFPVSIHYIAQAAPNTTQSYRADCVYDAKQKSLVDFQVIPL